jgi:hypothetical protein
MPSTVQYEGHLADMLTTISSKCSSGRFENTILMLSLDRLSVLREGIVSFTQDLLAHRKLCLTLEQYPLQSRHSCVSPFAPLEKAGQYLQAPLSFKFGSDADTVEYANQSGSSYPAILSPLLRDYLSTRRCEGEGHYMRVFRTTHSAKACVGPDNIV